MTMKHFNTHISLRNVKCVGVYMARMTYDVGTDTDSDSDSDTDTDTATDTDTDIDVV